MLSSVRREEPRHTERRLRHKKQAKVQQTVVMGAADVVNEIKEVSHSTDVDLNVMQQCIKELETDEVIKSIEEMITEQNLTAI